MSQGVELHLPDGRTGTGLLDSGNHILGPATRRSRSEKGATSGEGTCRDLAAANLGETWLSEDLSAFLDEFVVQLARAISSADPMTMSRVMPARRAAEPHGPIDDWLNFRRPMWR
jgi:hypothetical protein